MHYFRTSILDSFMVICRDFVLRVRGIVGYSLSVVSFR